MATKSVDLGKFFWDRKTQVLLVEVQDNLVNSGGKLKKERMVDEFDIIVERT